MTISTAELRALASGGDETSRRLAAELLACRDQARAVALAWEVVRQKLERSQSRGDAFTYVTELDATLAAFRRQVFGDEPIARRFDVRASEAGVIERMFAAAGKRCRGGRNPSVLAWIATNTQTIHERAPVEGTVLKVHVTAGDRVEAGALLATIEAGPAASDDED